MNWNRRARRNDRDVNKKPYTPDNPGMTESLAGVLANASLKEKEEARAMLLHYVGELSAIKNADPVGVAATVHDVQDTYINEAMNRPEMITNKISCRPGCNHCCHLLIGIWPQEAALLAAKIIVDKIEIDTERLYKQAEVRNLEGWNKLPIQDRRCVLLGDDGKCRAYEERPGACRKYYVASNPQLCDTVKHNGAKVARYVINKVEIIESAALTSFGGRDMPRALKNALIDPPDLSNVFREDDQTAKDESNG